MKSMTGFGSGRATHEHAVVQVEIKVYNNRYAEYSLNLPSALGVLESWTRQQLDTVIQRGKVDVHVRFGRHHKAAESSLNNQAIQYMVGLLQQLASHGLQPQYQWADLEKQGVFENHNDEALEIAYRSAFDQALQQVEQFRQHEGQRLAIDMVNLVQFLQTQCQVMSALAPKADEYMHQTLRQKFVDVLGQPIAEQRIIEEIAASLVKINVHEELVRFASHLQELHILFQSHQPMGRKLDFLCQELNREVNTLTSKTVLYELQKVAIEVKEAIEKLKEQARNVE
jgi:uncharacterized protein (TIGR00255 family)